MPILPTKHLAIIRRHHVLAKESESAIKNRNNMFKKLAKQGKNSMSQRLPFTK